MWPGIGDRSNVWIGTSVEDQEQANKRIPELLKVPAAVRFLSCEPLLGPVDITWWIGNHDDPGDWDIDCLRGIWSRIDAGDFEAPECQKEHDGGLTVDWVIVGGESGPHARRLHLDWIRSLRDQCREAEIPCFVKQLGHRPVQHSAGGDRNHPDYHPLGWRDGANGIAHHAGHLHLEDKKCGDWSEWPEDLRVREFPRC